MVHKYSNIFYEIILALLNSDMHVREIAKKLNTPHPTIIRKLKELHDNDTIDFKIEGKNKIYFLKKGLNTIKEIENAENYKLIKLINEYPSLEPIIAKIAKICKEDIILVFGSYAKFKAKKESDIDIYVFTDNLNVIKDIESVNSRINVNIGGFDNKSPLIKEIIKNHVIVKGVDKYYEKTGFFE